MSSSFKFHVYRKADYHDDGRTKFQNHFSSKLTDSLRKKSSNQGRKSNSKRKRSKLKFDSNSSDSLEQ